MDGKVPAKGVKRRTASPLWVGSTSEGDMVKEDAEMFIWQQDKLRLPDETKLRPTSLPGYVPRPFTATLSDFAYSGLRLPSECNTKSP